MAGKSKVPSGWMDITTLSKRCHVHLGVTLFIVLLASEHVHGEIWTYLQNSEQCLTEFQTYVVNKGANSPQTDLNSY